VEWGQGAWAKGGGRKYGTVFRGFSDTKAIAVGRNWVRIRCATGQSVLAKERKLPHVLLNGASVLLSQMLSQKRCDGRGSLPACHYQVEEATKVAVAVVALGLQVPS
jgi:hypothetical protein